MRAGFPVAHVHLSIHGQGQRKSLISKCARLLVLLALLFVLLPVGSSRGEPATNTIAVLDAHGLSAFNAGSANLLRDAGLRLQHLVREQDPGEPGHDFDPVATRYDPSDRRLEQTYRWGSLACAYTPVTDGLDLVVTVRNTSPRPLQAVHFDVLRLHFPTVPDGVPWQDRWTILRGGAASEEPPAIVARWEDGSLALYNEILPQEMVFGFRPDFPTGDHALVIQRQTPLPAGESATCQLHLRAGAPKASLRDLAAPAYDAFAQKHPRELQWNDHRPIATVFFATSIAGYPHNPRGWLLDASLDTTTDVGRAKFKEAMLRRADETIRNARRLNAQGLIVWDVEGQEMPHPTSYLGDPRVLSQAAPEMDAIADEIFARVRAAGLRTGVTIRPTRPVRKAGANSPWEQTVVSNPTAEMQAKITYARQRWGCTLFYADSNVEDRQLDGRTQTRTMPAAVFEQLARQNPDILLMPEHAEVQYWATTVPYKEYPQGYSSTPDEVHAVYPQAFTVLRVVDGPPLEAHWSELMHAVAAGDVLLFRAWWSDPVNDQVKRLYEEAAASPPAPARGTLRQAAGHRLLLGCAMASRDLDDPKLMALVTNQFDCITPECDFMPARLVDDRGNYTFDAGDRVVAFAEAQHLPVLGHMLIWHQVTRLWLFADPAGKPLPREKALANLKNYIDSVMGHYRGRIKAWNVVNEAISDDDGEYLRDTPARRAIGDDYIEQAFEFAHAADPKAGLYCNDYNIEQPAKLAKTLRLIHSLQAKGVAINAVGIQGHWLLGWPPTDMIDRGIDALAATGVKVMITELDVDPLPREVSGADMAVAETGANPYPHGLPPDVQTKLAKRYGEIVAAIVRHPSATMIGFWGTHDGRSWLNDFPVRGRTNHPLLFDRDYQPKPAFDAVIEALKAAGQAGPGRSAEPKPMGKSG